MNENVLPLEMDIDEKINNFDPPNWDDEVYNVDWNEEADYPAIDYNSDPVSSQFEKSLVKERIAGSEIQIEENNDIVKDIIIDDETVGYNYDISEINTTICSRDDPKSNKNNYNESNSPDNQIKKVKTVRQKLSQEEREKCKIAKEQKKLEKEKLKKEKKAEQLRQKASKAALLENKRNLKPEENIKFLKVHIDNEVINSLYGANIISVLQQNNIQFIVEAQLKSCTIIWSKKKVEKIVNDNGELIDKVSVVDEEPMLYIIGWEKAVELVKNNEMLIYVETIRSAYIGKKLTLVIYGIQQYFNFQKSIINKKIKAEFCEKMAKPKSYERVYEEAPNISKDQLEFALTELQILGKHNCRLLETPEELSALVLNFTKSLSQIDYKLDKLKRQEGDLGCFVTSDSNQCVKVDKNGNGLMHLWQQQICQFSSVGLETAQAVVSHFTSPAALVKQYEKCASTKEGELMLENIQIRREAGILSSSRRIGPQLSKKIYNFFTSDDPNSEL